MTEHSHEVKRTAGNNYALAFVDRFPRLGWYIAVISTLGVLLDFVQLLIH